MQQTFDVIRKHVNGRQLPIGAELKADDDAELAAAKPDGTISSAARDRQFTDRAEKYRMFSHIRKQMLSITKKLYTVNHKKRDILFLTINWLILTDFYSFYIILIVKKFYTQLQ